MSYIDREERESLTSICHHHRLKRYIQEAKNDKSNVHSCEKTGSYDSSKCFWLKSRQRYIEPDGLKISSSSPWVDLNPPKFRTRYNQLGDCTGPLSWREAPTLMSCTKKNVRRGHIPASFPCGESERPVYEQQSGGKM